MRIGSSATATKLHNYYGDENPEVKRAPNGFRRIGAGCSRTAILEKSTGIVYKIGDTWANEDEASTAVILSKKPSNRLEFKFKVPSTSVWKMRDASRVVAQRFVDGRRTWCASLDVWRHPTPKCTCKHTPCFSDVFQTLRDFTELEDIHEENVLLDKAGTFWLIDMAS